MSAFLRPAFAVPQDSRVLGRNIDTPSDIAVVIPTFNQQSYITGTLESVLRQVVEDDFHVVVMDDASTDNTPSILADYAARYPETLTVILNKTNLLSQGISPLLVFVANVNCRLMAFCDGDDGWLLLDKLSEQRHFLDTHPECALVHTDFVPVAEHPEDEARLNAMESVRRDSRRSSLESVDGLALLDGNFIIKSSVLIRKARLDEYFDDIVRCAGPILDWITWTLACQDMRIGYLPQRTTLYRVHPAQAWEALPQQVRAQETDQATWRLATRLGPTFQAAMRQRILARNLQGLLIAATEHADDGLPTTLRGLKESGLEPRLVIDVGAHAGGWTATAARFWPDARYLLMEPQVDIPIDPAVSDSGIDVTWLRMGAGPETGEATFFQHERRDSSSFRLNNPSRTVGEVALPITRLENVIHEHGQGLQPILLKLDCEGWDLEVLKGLGDSVEQVHCIFLEVGVSNPHFTENTLETAVSTLSRLGFKPVDVVAAVRHPGHGLLWNADVCFLRADTDSSHRASQWEE